MDPTALVTFLFKAPPDVRTVELIGSWDNFSQPYRMHHDRRRGQGFWSGCFKFLNIVFDGDQMQWAKPRNGGLKQGGTYWYYYRLNDEAEAYDDRLETTTNCPLMPGQVVNIIQIPVEIVRPPSRCQSVSMDVAVPLAKLPSLHTLDPHDRFAALHPPPVSKVHRRCISDLALKGRLERTLQCFRSESISPTKSPCLAERGRRSAYAVSQARPESRGQDTASFRSSIESAGRWSSAAPSLAHSSVVDAALHLESDPVPSTATPDAIPILESAVSDAEETADSNDLDFEDSCANRNPPATTDELDCPASVDDNSIHHSTTRLVKFDASRRSISHNLPISWREVLYSTHNSLYQDCRSQHSASSSQISPRYVPDMTVHRTSSDSPASSSSCSEPSFNPEGRSTDIASPTFSIPTLSSNGGLNTPFRLSLGPAHSGISQLSADNDEHIESFTERLRSLQFSSDDRTSSEDIAVSSSYVQQGSTTFAGYTLSQVAEESMQSLNKLPSAHDSHGGDHDLAALPSILANEGHAASSSAQRDSRVDVIFSELGYLGACIA